MGKTVKDIELIFENLDYVVIPNHYFPLFYLEDIKVNISRVATNAIVRYQTSDISEFTLSKGANDDFYRFDKDMEIDIFNSFFDRIIKCPDLTHIKLIYTDNDSEIFSVKWADEDDYGFRNKLQEAHLTEDGALSVIVGVKESH